MSLSKRKCENWLKTFGQWTLPRSEAPETFIFWTGLFTLASVVRRHVKIPKTMFGSWEASPNLYVMFIAPPGAARKSTTANYTEDLLDFVPDLTKAPELITKESLLSTIVKSTDNSIAITAPEFGEFIAKSGPDMYGFLTNIYDGKKNISASTLSRGLELAERPCVNLLGATTPIWLADNMPESVIGGGFASRVIFIFEETVRRRKLYYEDLDHDLLDRLHKDLVDDLIHISNEISGEFKIEKDAKEFMEDWYNKNAEMKSVAEYKMHGYYERRPAHIHKVAMLLHLAYSDELVLTQQDFIEAITLMKQVEKKLPKTFQSIGKNTYVVDAKRIAEFVLERKKVSQAELYSQFFHVATPNMLQEFITALVLMGEIKMLVQDNTTFYTAP
jgi:hypothetical protein